MDPEDTDQQYEPGDVEPTLTRSEPQVVAPVQNVTMEAVQRYIEEERNRSRGTLVWTTTVFLFVLILVLTMFVSIGIFVLRNARKAATIADEMQTRTAAYAEKVVGISNRVGRIEQGHVRTITAIDRETAERDQNERTLQRELARFSQWVSLRRARDADALASVEARLRREMENRDAARQRELVALRDQYTQLLAGLETRRVVTPRCQAFR